MIVYCQNDPCENEATHLAERKFGETPLCLTCKNAYELGQRCPGKPTQPLTEYPEKVLTEILDPYEYDLEETKDGTTTKNL